MLEKTMDCDNLDADMISSEVLGISQNRWNAIMEMQSERTTF
ncbi:MAG: YjcQ family protein [Bacteroides sp.]